MIDNFRPRVDLKPDEYSDIAEYSLGSGEVLADVINRYIVGNPQAINFIKSYKKVGCKVEDKNIWLDFVINNDGSQTIYYWLPTGSYTIDTDLLTFFEGHRVWKDIELSGMILDDTNPLKTGYIFDDCSLPASLDFTNASLSNNARQIELERISGNITGLDGFDTSNITNIYLKDNDLLYLDMSGWDMTKCKEIEVYDTTVSGNINLSNWTIGKQTGYITDLLFEFNGGATYNLSGWDLTNRESLNSLFYTEHTLGNLIGLETWDVSGIKDFRHMFYNIYFDSLNLSNWDMTSVDTQNGYADSIFDNCEITDLYLNGWSIPDGFADDCSPFGSLGEGSTIHVDNWIIGGNLDNMFENCSAALEGLDTWNVSGVQSMSKLFYSMNDDNIGDIIEQLSGWDVSNVQSYDDMFRTGYTTIDFSYIDSWRDLIDPTASFDGMVANNNNDYKERLPRWNGVFDSSGTFIPYTGSEFPNGIYFSGFIYEDDVYPISPQFGDAITDRMTYTDRYYAYDGTSWIGIMGTPTPAPPTPAPPSLPLVPDQYYYEYNIENHDRADIMNTGYATSGETYSVYDDWYYNDGDYIGDYDYTDLGGGDFSWTLHQ